MGRRIDAAVVIALVFFGVGAFLTFYGLRDPFYSWLGLVFVIICALLLKEGGGADEEAPREAEGVRGRGWSGAFFAEP